MDVWVVAFLGIFLGCLSRIILPYLRKAKENPNLVFDTRYAVTFAVAVIMALIASMLILAGFEIPEGQVYKVFAVSFLTGWGAQDVLNQIIDTGSHQ